MNEYRVISKDFGRRFFRDGSFFIHIYIYTSNKITFIHNQYYMEHLL